MADTDPPPDPTHGAVRLAKLDTRAQRQMGTLVHTAVPFAAAILKYPYGHQIAQIAEAMGLRIIDGSAAEGFELDDLCSGRTSAGHIRDAFTEMLPAVIDISVRTMLTLAERRAIHEHITSLPVRTGRQNNAIATDHNPGAAHMAHVLLSAVGASDSQFASDGRWLTTGTRHSHSSVRARPDQIAKLAAELKRPIPGPLWEHLRELFAKQRRTREGIAKAYSDRHPAFARYGIDPDRFVKGVFPKCLIIESILCGPPEKRLASSATELFPGDDEDVIETVAAAGRYGVAKCEVAEPKVALEQLEDVLVPALAERFGETPELISPERLQRIADWLPARELGVGVSIRFVRYWHFPKAKRLLRAEQVSGNGEVVDVSVWQTIRLESLRPAIVLIERAHQTWPRSCNLRFGRDCAPGLCGSWTARPREALMQISLAPNAAGVTAHRSMERRAFGA